MAYLIYLIVARAASHLTSHILSLRRKPQSRPPTREPNSMQQAAEARYSAMQRGAARSPSLRASTELPRSSLEADPEYLLAIERQQRQLLDVRLQAQMDANEALRRDNLELASHSAATSRQLRAALRSRDELRHQAAEATALDEAVRAAVSRRSLRAAQALCASLRARVYALEGQVAQLQSAALRDEASRCGVELPPLARAAGGGAGTPCGAETPWGGDALPDTPHSRSPRRLSPPSSPAGGPGVGSEEATRSRPPRRAAPPVSTPVGVSMSRGGGCAGGGGSDRGDRGDRGDGGGSAGHGRCGASEGASSSTPDAAILASFAGALSGVERQVLLTLALTLTVTLNLTLTLTLTTNPNPNGRCCSDSTPSSARPS